MRLSQNKTISTTLPTLSMLIAMAWGPIIFGPSSFFGFCFHDLDGNEAESKLKLVVGKQLKQQNCSQYTRLPIITS